MMEEKGQGKLSFGDGRFNPGPLRGGSLVPSVRAVAQAGMRPEKMGSGTGQYAPIPALTRHALKHKIKGQER